MVLVRRVDPGDGSLLRRVRLAALHDAPSAFGSTYEAEAVRPESEWVERAQAGAQGVERVTFFAEADGDVVGLVGGYCEGAADHINLVSLWVAPAARRHGVARALALAVLDWAASVHGSEVVLWVRRDNVPAESLYASMGFSPTGTTRPLSSDPSEEEVELVLAIS